jgi:hypothetical protein
MEINVLSKDVVVADAQNFFSGCKIIRLVP